jgi:hypothetical protein
MPGITGRPGRHWPAARRVTPALGHHSERRAGLKTRTVDGSGGGRGRYPTGFLSPPLPPQLARPRRAAATKTRKDQGTTSQPAWGTQDSDDGSVAAEEAASATGAPLLHYTAGSGAGTPAAPRTRSEHHRHPRSGPSYRRHGAPGAKRRAESGCYIFSQARQDANGPAGRNNNRSATCSFLGHQGTKG